MWKFYKECFRRAAKPALTYANGVAALVGIGLGLVVWYRPTMNNSMAPLAGTVPVSAFLGVFAWQFIKAPFTMYRQLQEASTAEAEDMARKMRQLEHRAMAAEDALKDYRDYQQIADVLTKLHEYGVHQILNVPPKDADTSLDEWNRWVDNWNQRLFLDMQQLGCTVQEINHVKTISLLDVAAGLPELPSGAVWGDFKQNWAHRVERWNAEAARKIEVPVRMHAIRLDRVAAVSTRYAQLAESMRSPRGK